MKIILFLSCFVLSANAFADMYQPEAVDFKKELMDEVEVLDMDADDLDEEDLFWINAEDYLPNSNDISQLASGTSVGDTEESTVQK